MQQFAKSMKALTSKRQAPPRLILLLLFSHRLFRLLFGASETVRSLRFQHVRTCIIVVIIIALPIVAAFYFRHNSCLSSTPEWVCVWVRTQFCPANCSQQIGFWCDALFRFCLCGVHLWRRKFIISSRCGHVMGKWQADSRTGTNGTCARVHCCCRHRFAVQTLSVIYY